MPVTQDFNLDTDVDLLLSDFRPYHSALQMDAFITTQNGMGHPWGMYQQALREINSRKANIATLQDQLEMCELDIADKVREVEAFAWTRKAKARRARARIELNSLRRKREEYLINQVDATRELKHFVGQGTMLKEHLGGPITEEKREELDRGWWIHRLKVLIAQQVMQQGQVSVDIWEMLPGLPNDVRQQVQECVDEPTKAVEYYKTTTSKPIRLQSVGLRELSA
jgi:hypothetical protein